jgi:hypothetical protein
MLGAWLELVERDRDVQQQCGQLGPMSLAWLSLAWWQGGEQGEELAQGQSHWNKVMTQVQHHCRSHSPG